MSYVISHRLDGGFVKIKAGKGSWATALKNATKFNTLENATNFMDINFTGTYPGVNITDVKILNVEDLTEGYNMDGSEYTEETAKQALEDMMTFYSQIADKTKQFLFLPSYYSNIVKQCDLETLDMLHKIEFTNENVVNGYKRYKQIQEIRQRRRVAKDSLEIANLIASSGLISSLEHIKEGIEHQNEVFETRKYKPRVLVEMFGDPEEGVNS